MASGGGRVRRPLRPPRRLFNWPVTRQRRASVALDHFAGPLPRPIRRASDARATGRPFLSTPCLALIQYAGLLAAVGGVRAGEAAFAKAGAASTRGGHSNPPDPRLAGVIRGVYWAEDAGLRETKRLGAEAAAADSTGPARRTWHYACRGDPPDPRPRLTPTTGQRLMVTGNFALLAGLRPRRRWRSVSRRRSRGRLRMGRAAHTSTAWRCSPNGGVVRTKAHAAFGGPTIDRIERLLPLLPLRRREEGGRGRLPVSTTLLWHFLMENGKQLPEEPPGRDDLIRTSTGMAPERRARRDPLLRGRRLLGRQSRRRR